MWVMEAFKPLKLKCNICNKNYDTVVITKSGKCAFCIIEDLERGGKA